LKAYAEVAPVLPVQGTFTYRVPEALRGRIVVGASVRVPFGGRREQGFVVALRDECGLPPEKLRSLALPRAEIPPLPSTILEFTRRMAEEYACAWGLALAAALPSSLKRRGLRTIPGLALVRDEEETRALAMDLEDRAEKRARVLRHVLELGSPVPLRTLMRRSGVSRSPIETLVKHGFLRWTRIEQEDEFLVRSRMESAPRHELNPAQRRAVERIREAVRAGSHRSFLLYGVTGSGKTEVYLRVLEEVRRRNRGAIILVPEISLTPQTCGRFLSRFPDVAVLHSSLTDATRASEWLRLLRGEARIVVGARSALFAPVRDLGLIVVDEEHEGSFKQQQSPRYHARDMAVLRGSLEGAVVVLGSATPSLESWHRVKEGCYVELRLPERAGAGTRPKVLVVDMRQEKPERGGPPVLSRRLRILLQERLRAREQAILFLNRRGFAPALFCNTCGDAVRCPDCDVAMTWHVSKGRLLCHYCRFEMRHPELCPSCGVSRPGRVGAGTEQVEAEVRRFFPEIVVARMDSDTMVSRDSYENVLEAFRRGDIDVLVGTQMIAKGLDFPRVTLVGVVAAETGLFQPDFRAGERCFQLLSQVSGRAGRGDREGLVVVQTSSPEAEPIRRAVAHDLEGFVSGELEARKALGYPPFGRLVRIVAEGREARAVEARIGKVASELQRLGVEGVEICGPAPAPLARLRGKWRFHLFCKCSGDSALEALRPSLLPLESKRAGGVRLLLDLDPVSML